MPIRPAAATISHVKKLRREPEGVLVRLWVIIRRRAAADGAAQAGPVTPPAARFHPHSGQTGSSEAMRRHLGQIRMATSIIAYFVDPTDRKVYPKGRSIVAGGDPADAPPAPTRARRGTTRSKRAAHSKARDYPERGQGHVHGAGPRHPARGDRGARPLGGRRRARQHLPSR